MRSRPALLLLAVLLAASSADSQDLYAALGKQFVIPLETKLNHLAHFCSRFVWKYQKSDKEYLSHIAEMNGDCKKKDCIRPNCSLTNNGSLFLHHVTAQDSGLYTITTYYPNRNLNTERNFHLHVLDAVSDPVVTFHCLSDGSLRVMCSAGEGTRPHIQLTINEESAWESEMRFMNVTKSLPPPWNITCSAKNNVSQEMTSVFFQTCPDPLLDPVLDVSCHPNGSVKISCAVASGSDPLYSWFVDGQQALQSDANSSWRVSGNHIAGDAFSARNVSCLVRNAVSQVQTPQQLVHCPETGEELGVAERYVKVFLFIMYSALLVQCVSEMRRTAAANQ